LTTQQKKAATGSTFSVRSLSSINVQPTPNFSNWLVSVPAGGIGAIGGRTVNENKKCLAKNRMSNQPFVWFDCVADFRETEIIGLAAARGYRVEFVRWLHQHGEVGRYYVPGTSWCTALPIRDGNGDVFRCHCRGESKKIFKYEPADPDKKSISAMVLGDLVSALRVHIHESEWDALAQISALRLEDEIYRGEACVIATRGAADSKRISPDAISVAGGTNIYLYPQNDTPDRYGRVASEEWLRGCVDELGGAYVVRIPAAHKDLNDWIRAADFTTDQLEYAIDNAPLEKRKGKFPAIVTGDIIEAVHQPLPAEVIRGILAIGEKGSLVGGSKAYKTWTLLHQALAVASGTDWWGFSCPQNNSLFLNLELPPPYFENRVRTVAFAMGIKVPANFHVWHLRRAKLGDPERWGDFVDELVVQASAIANPFITSDPIYKLLGGRNENDAGDVGSLLEQIDDLIEVANGSNFFGQHTTKGNQAAKEAIDRAAGSGVFARDPDTIFPMTAHEKPGAFVIEPILRNHSPLPPFVVEWQPPLFVRNPLLDPGELKGPKVRTGGKYDMHMLAFWLGAKRLRSKQFAVLVGDETGMSRATFYELLKKAEAASLIKRDPTDKDYWIKK
jgi:hypothetical protein